MSVFSDIFYDIFFVKGGFMKSLRESAMFCLDFYIFAKMGVIAGSFACFDSFSESISINAEKYLKELEDLGYCEKEDVNSFSKVLLADFDKKNYLTFEDFKTHSSRIKDNQLKILKCAEKGVDLVVEHRERGIKRNSLSRFMFDIFKRVSRDVVFKKCGVSKICICKKPTTTFEHLNHLNSHLFLSVNNIKQTCQNIFKSAFDDVFCFSSRIIESEVNTERLFDVVNYLIGNIVDENDKYNIQKAQNEYFYFDNLYYILYTETKDVCKSIFVIFAFYERLAANKKIERYFLARKKINEGADNYSIYVFDMHQKFLTNLLEDVIFEYQKNCDFTKLEELTKKLLQEYKNVSKHEYCERFDEIPF